MVMVDNRITKERVRHHFTYGVWKYVALVAVAILGWDLIYSLTAYRPPDNKKLDVYILSPGADVERMRSELDIPLREAFPDQEEFNFIAISLGSGEQEDPYALMQFSTYLAAQEGDLFLMPLDRFRQYALTEGGGMFVPLDDWLADGTLKVSDADLLAGRLTPPEGVSGAYGVSAAALYGLAEYMIDNRPMMWAVPAYSGNQENAVKLIAWMMEHATEKPAWYDDGVQ